MSGDWISYFLAGVIVVFAIGMIVLVRILIRGGRRGTGS